MFEPIAIVGQSCILPGAHSPEELWNIFTSGQTLIKDAPKNRWRISMARAIHPSGKDASWTDKGAYVEKEVLFDHPSYEGLDPLFHWTAHCAQESLKSLSKIDPKRISLILANLSFPSEGMSRSYESLWFEKAGIPSSEEDGGDSRNRMMSGLPATMAADILGVGDAFALDAACASALYAIKLAAIKLNLNEVDGVLVGAVNRADPLFIHHGFTALQALSKSGQSRPFHPQADGLVPSEGCVFVALKRVTDLTEDDQLLGIIRSVGLSNDGRSKGFLAPSKKGQEVAIASAFSQCEVKADQISYVECHATGTQLGDATELAAMKSAYDKVDIGSHKGNLGHSITVSGLVSTLKILGLFEHRLLPATPGLPENINHTHPSTLNVVRKNKAFHGDYAALSAFGFGGNNAHMILQSPTSWAKSKRKKQVNSLTTNNALKLLAMSSYENDSQHRSLSLPLDGLRFPPNDLKETTRQQLLVLKCAQDLVSEFPHELDKDRTGVFIGMACDPEVTRFGARWRAAEKGLKTTDFETHFAPLLRSAGVIGCMPNVVANRLNTQFDFRGPSFSVSSNTLSGLDALECARLLIASGDIDHAIVGTVFSPGPDIDASKNDACFLLLIAGGNSKLEEQCLIKRTTSSKTEPQHFHDANANPGLSFSHLFDALRPYAGFESPSPKPDLAQKASAFSCALGGQTRSYQLTSGPAYHNKKVNLPHIAIFRSDDKSGLIKALENANSSVPATSTAGPACICFLYLEDTYNVERLRALAHLRSKIDAPFLERGCAYFPQPLRGEVAFVYSGSASPSGHFFREMLSTYRALSNDILAKVGAHNAAQHLDWVYQNKAPSPESQIWAVSLASQIHTRLSTIFFGLRPDAAIGFSLGESSMLFSLGAWTDLKKMVDDLPLSEIFSEELCGSYRAVKKSWSSEDPIDWSNYTLLGPVDAVKEAARDLDRVHVSIINSPHECVISGEEKACNQIVRELKKKGYLSSKQAYDVAIHVPEVEAISAAYTSLHRRKFSAVDGIRFYSNAIHGAYTPSSEQCASMILGQATTTLDFPATIRQAYADGVRVFIEHGPHHLCTKWIHNILEGKDYLALSLDQIGKPAEQLWFEVAAALIASGRDIDVKKIRGLFSEKTKNIKTISIPAWDDVKMKKKSKQVKWSRPDALPRPPVSRWYSPKAKDLPNPQRAPLQPMASVPNSNLQNQSHIHTPSDAHRFFLEKQQEVYATFLAHFQESQALLQQIALGHASPAPVFPQVIFEQDALPSDTTPPLSTTQVETSTAQAKPSPTALSREQLEYMSNGSIADIWGEAFRSLDEYDVLVRMPHGKLLLADRVIEIDAEPRSMKAGRIRTQTDVKEGAWYLHCGRMPAGIMIESGQADLLLVSYLGVDLLNKGERAYRLLGCKLTYGASLPEIGETLDYNISIDGFAKHGDVRLFFFHYDCKVEDQTRLQVREGQAGFFTDAELAESGGVLWTPEDSEFDASLSFVKGEQESKLSSFSKEAFAAFSEGDLYGCFGEDFAYGATHSRTPGIWKGKEYRFLDEVEVLDFQGGPLKRGYLKATTNISPDDWYFDGHFHNDPCMPGTLMFEGCLQALTFFFAARGDTLKRDGWRCEPVPGMEFEMICRGQATPKNRFLEYEIFIESAYLSPAGHPTLIADLLVSVDGLKAFHTRRMAMRLVPDWPMTSLSPPMKTTQDSIPFDYPEMLATAIGRPSSAFGTLYKDFDYVKKAPRLPGKPYHFMTRVMEESGRNAMKVGARVVVEYDVPSDAWYFEHNQEMPFAVLLETGLQPCGWLASWVGCALNTASEVYFRNLDGEGEVFEAVQPNNRCIRTEVHLTKLVRSGETTLVGFDVKMSVDGKKLYELSTMFGFFPAQALASQAGLVADTLPEHFEWKAVPEIEIDKLCMVDEIVDTGDHIYGRRKFHASDWFFKSHFFQDPVQPGSLGLEAMIQCLKARVHDKSGEKKFSTLLNHPHTWSYRGQVRPHNLETIVDVKIVKEDTNIMIGDGFLWTDGSSIYRFSGFGISYE